MPPRAGSAEARAIKINEVQMMTVITAAANPMVRGDKAPRGEEEEGCIP